ncbi:MAG: hypothetical protein R2784_21105 [Saprospiraceae bacterium]
MEKLLNTGRWIFPLSFLLYVGLHFGQPETGASFIPDWIPFPLFWNYFTGICIIAFIVSTVIGKYDKLATVLMALYVFLVLLIIHVPNAATSENDMLNIFRNIMVIGALFLFAKYAARDKRIIG